MIGRNRLYVCHTQKKKKKRKVNESLFLDTRDFIFFFFLNSCDLIVLKRRLTTADE